MSTYKSPHSLSPKHDELIYFSTIPIYNFSQGHRIWHLLRQKYARFIQGETWNRWNIMWTTACLQENVFLIVRNLLIGKLIAILLTIKISICVLDQSMSCNKTLLGSSTDGHCFVANTPVCSEDVNKVLKLILHRNILLESLISGKIKWNSYTVTVTSAFFRLHVKLTTICLYLSNQTLDVRIIKSLHLKNKKWYIISFYEQMYNNNSITHNNSQLYRVSSFTSDLITLKLKKLKQMFSSKGATEQIDRNKLLETE